MFCARQFLKISDVIRSIEGTEHQTLTKSAQNLQNLLLLLLSSDNLKIETVKEDLVYVEQSMIVRRPYPDPFN